MSLSLREQLLKAGLVTKKQAKQSERTASQNQHRAAKGSERAPSPDPARAADQARSAKLLRDQEMNRRQREKAAAKARAAELRQLVEQLRVPRPESDDYFNFVDGGRIRRLAVTPDLRARIVAGGLVIVRCEGRYELVPADSVQRILDRDGAARVSIPAAGPSADAPAEDDPYRHFVVPDDLTW